MACETEGFVVGHEVRLVNDDGQPVGVGEEGEILTRGPEVMIGYLRAEDNAAAFDDEGFFRTGDLGRFESSGALVITGRKKDLIIRGGENLSAKEIEDVLYMHPAVREAAVVAMPHPRLGEGICAFIVAHEQATPTLEELANFIAARGLARQKIPERLEIIGQMPRTASGKIQKFVLRERVRALIEAELR